MDGERERLHRCPGPERRFHAQGAEGLWHRRGRVGFGRGDVRPDPPDAHPDHHGAELHRRQGARRDPVRADHGRGGRWPAGAGGAEGARRRSLHQDRQGPRGRDGRRAADEADAGAGRLARPREAARRVRHQGALGHQPRQSSGHRRGGEAAVRGGAAGARRRPRPDHRARGQHQEPGARRRPTRSCWRNCWPRSSICPRGRR